MGTPARDMALAKVAMVAARTDSTRAGQIAFTVVGQPRPVQGQDRWQREAPPPPSMLADPNRAGYRKVRALTEIAIVVAEPALTVQYGGRMTLSRSPAPSPIKARRRTRRGRVRTRQVPRLTLSSLGNC